MEEIQYTTPIPLETKAIAEAGGEGRFTGHAAWFGNIDRNGDRIAPGAFAQSIAEAKDANTNGQFYVYRGHDQDKSIGFAHAAEDDQGLLASVELSLETKEGLDAYKWLKFCEKRGVKPGLSIGFYTRDFDYDQNVRVLKSVDLMEISLVTHPANPRARVEEVKGVVLTHDLTRIVEQGLRDVGLSHTKAKTFMAVVKQPSSEARRDVSGLKQPQSDRAMRLRELMREALLTK
jgi:uncharacterized protein